MKRALPLIGALVVAACTYQTPVSFAPGFKVGELPAQGIEQRIGGRYVLVVGGIEKLSRKIRGRGLSCSSYSFRVDIGAITRDSVRQILGQVFEDLRIAQTAPTRKEMREQNVDGVITVRVDRFAPWLSFSNGTAALTNLDLSLTVEGANGPLFATSVTTVRRGEADADASCQGAAAAVARSVEFAIQDALTRLVDQLVASEELRQASTEI